MKSGFIHAGRLFVLLGSTLGYLATAFSLSDRLPGATTARLDAQFEFPAGNAIALAPSVMEGDSLRTAPFPLMIEVVNLGRRSAQDAELTIVCPPSLIVGSSGRGGRVQRVVSQYGARLQFTLPLGDVHPGQELHLADSLLAVAENTLSIPVHFKSKDSVAFSADVSTIVTYDIEVRLSARDAQQQIRNLYLTLGTPAGLDSTQANYLEESLDPRTHSYVLTRRAGHPRKFTFDPSPPKGWTGGQF